MYLLDTNHCSRIIQGDSAIVDRIFQVGESAVSTCVIVRGELLYMVYKSERKDTNLARVRSFLEDIQIYSIDEATADIYGQLKADIFERFGPKDKRKQRRTRLEHLGISENDLWIAAIALRNRLTIISSDRDFQRIQMVATLSLESWI
ncbi:type II toxin-antitoxin system VapC family toxin [Baaleninema sp.]|uniref:type II toxin-antitoxin system VapC family toxin n=1 Tax=Baaleninema sp. TaxID=3101197 RepID=UPI003D001C43